MEKLVITVSLVKPKLRQAAPPLSDTGADNVLLDVRGINLQWELEANLCKKRKKKASFILCLKNAVLGGGGWRRVGPPTHPHPHPHSSTIHLEIQNLSRT